MSKPRIIKNMIRCNLCDDVIESKTAHDFQQCSCGAVFVDGGLDYLRRGFKNGPEDFEELSVVETDEEGYV